MSKQGKSTKRIQNSFACQLWRLANRPISNVFNGPIVGSLSLQLTQSSTACSLHNYNQLSHFLYTQIGVTLRWSHWWCRQTRNTHSQTKFIARKLIGDALVISVLQTFFFATCFSAKVHTLTTWRPQNLFPVHIHTLLWIKVYCSLAWNHSRSIQVYARICQVVK